jgi:hypothetical protein
MTKLIVAFRNFANAAKNLGRQEIQAVFKCLLMVKILKKVFKALNIYHIVKCTLLQTPNIKEELLRNGCR